MNCKPGDMALLIRASVVENLGSICEVLGPGGVDGFDWSIRFQRPKRMLLSGDDSFVVGLTCLCSDAWLLPIRPQGVLTTKQAEAA